MHFVYKLGNAFYKTQQQYFIWIFVLFSNFKGNNHYVTYNLLLFQTNQKFNLKPKTFNQNQTN